MAVELEDSESIPVNELSPQALRAIKEKQQSQSEERDYIWLILDTLSREKLDSPTICERFKLDYKGDVYPLIRSLVLSGYLKFMDEESDCPACHQKVRKKTYELTKRGRKFLKHYPE